MDFFVRAVRGLSTVFGIVAAAALIAACLVVCDMVIERYFLRASTVWQTEFVMYSIVGATFVGSPYVLLTRGHVNVDLLPMYLGHRTRLILAVLVSVTALLFCAVLAWQSGEFWYRAWSGGWRTDTVWSLPLWIPHITLPIGAGLLVLQYVADIACLLTGREMPFGLKPGER
jgi:TRAP-type C4-dicarboxylate transport system permease small subunit